MKYYVFYSEEYGVRWYRCLNCGALIRGNPPAVCPVCEGRKINREDNGNE